MTRQRQLSLNVAYLIMGKTGEYGDAKSWPVRIVQNQERAIIATNDLNSRFVNLVGPYPMADIYEGRGHGMTYHVLYERIQREMAEVDPDFEMDYTGTVYYWVVLPSDY